MDRAPLPPVVNAIGDRINLDYHLERKSTARAYIDTTSKFTRLDKEYLSRSYYSLDESRTKDSNSEKRVLNIAAKNPLKLSSKVRKRLYKLTAEEKQKLKYNLFEKVHILWQQYINEVNKEKDSMKMFRCDLHGCKLECTASKNPTLIGMKGIVVQETRNTFLIITESNRLLTLPKRESIFEFRAGTNLYRIHGCNLLFNTQTRSKVKYKQQKSFSII